MLDGTNPLPCRLGAVEVMAALMQQLQRQLVPYTVLLVVPLLRRMSDPAAAVRRRAALCFGGLTALLPLAQGMPLPEGLDEVQRKAAEQDAEFLSQLLDNKRVEDYSLPVRLKVRMGLVLVVCFVSRRRGRRCYGVVACCRGLFTRMMVTDKGWGRRSLLVGLTVHLGRCEIYTHYSADNVSLGLLLASWTASHCPLAVPCLFAGLGELCVPATTPRA